MMMMMGDGPLFLIIGFYPHSPMYTIDGYIMETRFW